jgi:hypothetical protein
MSHNIVNVVWHVLTTEYRYDRQPTVSRICALTGMSRLAVQKCLEIIERKSGGAK